MRYIVVPQLFALASRPSIQGVYSNKGKWGAGLAEIEISKNSAYCSAHREFMIVKTSDMKMIKSPLPSIVKLYQASRAQITARTAINVVAKPRQPATATHRKFLQPTVL